MEFVLLYLVVSMVLCGFIGAACFVSTLQYRGGLDVGASETDACWGPPGMGKTYPRGITPPKAWPRFSGLSKIEWSYASAYDSSQDVSFTDPADAYEYVVEALVSKNRMIERLENAQWKGLPTNYEWLWIDAHIEREYWLDKLIEFKEDV